MPTKVPLPRETSNGVEVRKRRRMARFGDLADPFGVGLVGSWWNDGTVVLVGMLRLRLSFAFGLLNPRSA